MLRQSFKRFYLILGAVTLPTLVLAFLSYTSIQESIEFSEERYLNELTSNEQLLIERYEQIEAKWIQNTLAYTSYYRDWYFNPALWGQNPPPVPPTGFKHLVMTHGSRILYPHLAESNDLPSYLNVMDKIERSFYLNEIEGRSSQTQLNQRIERMRAPNLTTLDLLINHLGIIRSLRILGQNQRALQHIRLLNAELNWSADPLELRGWVWLEEFEIYRNTNSIGSLREFTQKVVRQVQNQNRQLDPRQLFALKKILSHTLSLESLSQRERTYLYNIFEHLNLIEIDYTEAQELNRDVLFNLQMAHPSNKAHLSLNNEQLYLFLPLTLSSPPIVGISIFDPNQVNVLFKQSLIGNRSSLQSVPFILEGKNHLSINNIADTLLIPYKNIKLSASSPYSNLVLFRIPQDQIEGQAVKRAKILYLLILFSFCAILYTAFIGVRILRKDRNLFFMKSNFLSSVTHELKTPLTSIKMFAEMMEKGRVQQIEKVQELSGLINKESDRLNLLISDILNYNRLEQGEKILQKEDISLKDISLDLIERLTPIADRKQISIHFAGDDTCPINADARSIDSMLQNLIENAIKYSPEKSEIFIELKTIDHRYYWSVEDQGQGIAKKEQHKIFNTFYRVGDELTRKTKGSGIGLAIVKKVADLHQAEVKVSSTLGEGSKFTVIFKGPKHVKNPNC